MGAKKGAKGKTKAPVQVVAWTPEQLSTVLTMLSQADTKIVKEGEEHLKAFLKHPACIAQLFTQLTGSPEVEVRHHAALLLKKKLGQHFTAFPLAERAELKSQFLQVMQSEPEHAVAVSVAGCVAGLAKSVFAESGAGGDWPELFQALLALAQNPVAKLRAINYNLLEQLAETIPDPLKPHLTTIAGLLTTGCTDIDHTVKMNAMQAVNSFIRSYSGHDEVMALEPILTPLLSVMQACLTSGDEAAVAEAFECIQEASEMEQPLINNHVDSLVPFIVRVLEHKDYDSAVKQAATFALISLIENRPKLLGKKNMVPPILNSMVALIASSDGKEVASLFQIGNEKEGILDDDEDDSDFEDEDDAISRNPQYILDTLSLNIPSKYFVQPALSLCSQCMSATDANHRKAGCFLLGVITEGCADSLREILSQILPVVLTAVQDAEFYVREVACFTLGQMSEFCQPEILRYHKEVLPVVFNALSDERPNVQNTSCYVLEFFCENLQPETLKPFLHPLLTKLCTLLQSPSGVTKEMALTAIAATAVAAEKEFLPFVDTICGLLQPLMFLMEEKEAALRGRSMECLGHIAVAIEREHFSKYFAMGMQSALQSFEMSNETLKEHSFIFFANVGKIMKEDMGPYLPVVMPKIVEFIGSPELEMDGGSDEDEDEIFEDEADDDDEHAQYRMVDGGKDTKKAAVTALGALAQHGGAPFNPEFLDMGYRCLLDDGLNTIHTDVRSEVLEVLAYMVWAGANHSNLPDTAPKGTSQMLPPALAEITSISMVTLLKTIKHDDEKRVVASAVGAASDIIGRIGMSALALPATFDNKDDGDDENKDEWKGMQILPVLMECITTLVMEKGVCQKRVHGEDDDDEDDDHDNVVMDQVSDIIGALAKVMGPTFVPYFDVMANPLLKFTKPQRSHTDRSMAIGCFGEVIGEVGMAAMKYIDVLLPTVQAGLQDTMEGVRRNCCFLIASLIRATGASMVSNFPALLQMLSPLCTRSADQHTSDAGGADIDNALAAVASMISASRDAVPMAQVLPVILNSLPLRIDFDEGNFIFKALCNLVLDGDAVALQMLPRLLVAFGQTLEPGSKASDETKVITSSCIKHLATDPAKMGFFQAAVQQIPDAAMQHVLISVVQ